MLILRKIKTFFTFDVKKMLMLIEAYYYLGWGRILICLPFSFVSARLGAHMHETSREENLADKQVLREIHAAIHFMDRYTFWQSECLVKAIAGSKMLTRRGIDSTLYLGTGREETGEMIAHAWLRSGPYYITGAEGMKRFTVVATFAKRSMQRPKGAQYG